jgi:hypothetical protein
MVSAMNIDQLLAVLWEGYLEITPQARRVHQLLAERGEAVVNDHIALRTFALPGIDIEDLDRAFVAAGYEPIESYRFAAKKLEACHYEHPARPSLPKVFISALEVDELSAEAAARIRALVAELPPGAAAATGFAASGRRWGLDRATYEALRAESEYAAWLAAFGFRANHFTVLVNALESFDSLEAIDAFLEDNGLALNRVGGTIKGGPEVYLEQSSTLADSIEVELSGGIIEIPSCYVELARRYPLPDGKLFSGFIADSADKIFESTDRGAER